jgi:glutathione peroxidase-family protein
MAEFYSLKCKDAEGKDFNMESLKGKVVVAVNVASKCGFTSQYKGLEELYKKHKDAGLMILGFPCNQFGGQEPGSSADVVSFCSAKYDVTFPIMEKVEVNGNKTHPVYAYMKSQKKSLMMELIKWNFEKFVIDREGNVVQRYASGTTPAAMEADLAKLL